MKYKNFLRLEKKYEEEKLRRAERDELKISLEFLRRDIGHFFATFLKKPINIKLEMIFDDGKKTHFVFHPYASEAFLNQLKRYSEQELNNDIKKIEKEIRDELEIDDSEEVE